MSIAAAIIAFLFSLGIEPILSVIAVPAEAPTNVLLFDDPVIPYPALYPTTVLLLPVSAALALAPKHGLVLNNFHYEVSLGEPFYVDVNFVLEIQSTENELPLEDKG